MNRLENVIGELCKVILPIPEESYIGNTDSSIAICTLSSIELLKKISNSELLNHISIAGRLLSENKGIDSIIKYINQNKKIKTIIICGKEVWGHRAGHSLIELHKNGIDNYGRIINSISPNPILTVTKSEINYFQNEIKLVNIINETNFDTIKKFVI
jgi:tetrahydromethanopterin S-methyltransferase subunit A